MHSFIKFLKFCVFEKDISCSLYNTKQKIVIKVQLTSENCRTKALKIAAEAKGVSNVSIDVEKAVVEVIGIGVDAVSLAQSLEKKLGFASIVSVGEVKKPEAPKPVLPIEWTSSYIHCPRYAVHYDGLCRC
ncbi:heavy metal-associated isoprenylated plant protein 47 [Prunus yedoensis var. nudiflora]|uniref:Heavy metal-associated isoprenylated plant protein 47 n=1 Tax=Prunus yedoensis var. nudiflora TaxID=2094558 RepID=A0A314Z9F5_PRUYE|nr:heavy metal-associated isoprenylated plant protein 47 [Prunus yedoensis var. nudiflora]